MKQIKRASALLLALLVALSAMAITAFAEGTPAIVVDGFDGEPLTEGATVTLKVHYNDFLPFQGFTFLVDYDRDALELVDIGYSYEVVEGVSVPYIADGSYITNMDYVPGGSDTEAPRPAGVVDGLSYGYVGYIKTSDGDPVTAIRENNTVFTVTLKAKSLTEAKNAWVKPILWEMYSFDEEGNATNLMPSVTQPEAPVEIPVAQRAPLAYTVTLAPNHTEVGCGEELKVAVNITGENGASYNSADLTLTYDTSLFTYVSAVTGETLKVTEDNGTVKIINVGADRESGSALTTLTFTSAEVTEPASGDFTLTSAKVDNRNNAMAQDVPDANTENCTVKIVPKFPVIFLNKDGGELKRELVNYGEAVSEVPAAPAVDWHDFAGWQDGSQLYQQADILRREVTAAVTYQAAYTPKNYTVTHNGTEGAATATYGVDYVGSIAGFDGDNYDYEVSYTVNGSTLKATVNTDGTFTIPGSTIKGDIVTAVSRAIKGVTVELYEDYVAGYTLIVVKGNAAAYAYDGSAMYKTPAYGDTAFAWLVEGKTTEAEVKALLTAAAQARGTIPAGSRDVNITGSVDVNDAQAVYNLYNITADYPIAQHMEKYLRADVNGDHRVDVTDLNAVLAQI